MTQTRLYSTKTHKNRVRVMLCSRIGSNFTSPISCYLFSVFSFYLHIPNTWILLNFSAGVCWNDLCSWCNGIHLRHPNIPQDSKGVPLSHPSLLRSAHLLHLRLPRRRLHPQMEPPARPSRLPLRDNGGMHFQGRV